MLKRIFTPYALLSFLLVLLLPVVCVLLLELTPMQWRMQLSGAVSRHLPLILCVLFAILAGWLWAGKAPLPDSLFARLLPLFLPLPLLSLAHIPLALTDRPVAGLFVVILMIAGGYYGSFYLPFLIRSERRCRSTAKIRGAACLLGIILACSGVNVAVHYIATRDILPPGKEASVGHGVETWNYHPFSEDNRLVQPASTPSLRIASDHPRLDGAIGAFPLYAAFAQAVYAGLNVHAARDIVSCTNTLRAYKRLAANEVDIFFGAAPSQEQREAAAAQGLSLTETPIGKTAFVFIVHQDNPVRSLTQAQIRAVYSGRIRNWKELDGPDEALLAFQRPEGSGSQSAMLRIMEGEAMVRPLREERSAGMGDIVLGVADYRNRKNALGYSFRWYVTTLFAHPDIRLLAIDGVEPTPENIRNNAYPFTVPLLAVTARPLSPQGTSLLTWIIGPEGQDLLERVGHVPLR
jgi:phosphate transport system substrate-binding protein